MITKCCKHSLLPQKNNNNKIVKIKTATCFQENTKLRNKNSAQAWQPLSAAAMPALPLAGTFGALSSDWPAGDRLSSDWLASDCPSSDWPAGAAAGVSAGLGWAAPRAPVGFSCFLLPVAVWESTAEVFLSFRIKGPWLYGDGEAHTEYVQNDFYKQS